jgi:hypothetical protein
MASSDNSQGTIRPGSLTETSVVVKWLCQLLIPDEPLVARIPCTMSIVKSAEALSGNLWAHFAQRGAQMTESLNGPDHRSRNRVGR